MEVMSGFGATTPRPPIIDLWKSMGLSIGDFMHECNARPSGVTQSTAYAPVPNYPGWSYAYYAEADGVTYMHVKAEDDAFWIYPHTTIPCGGSSKDSGGAVSSSRPAMVRNLQNALNEMYLAADPVENLAVDGIAGPRTCAAAYGFQYEVMGIDNAELRPETFEALNLPGDYSVTLGRICGEYYEQHTAPTPPTPDVVVKEPPTAIITAQKAGFPWWGAVLVGGAMLGIAAAGGFTKKRKKGKRKARRQTGGRKRR